MKQKDKGLKSKVLESDPKLEILRYLTKKGYICWKHHKKTFNEKIGTYVTDPYTPSGLPDIMCVNSDQYGQLWGLEVKRPKGGVTSPAQLLMKRRFELNNARYEVVKSVEEVKKLGL